jgi:hypothetical protein
LILQLRLIDSFVVCKEEHLVFLDWTAERASILIFPKIVLLRGGPGDGIKDRVARKIIGRSVQGVSARTDPAKRLTLKGTVVEWFWANPHCFLQFDVKGDDGEPVRWVTETSNPPDMINRGWSIRSFKAGDEVTVVVRPVKSGKPVGSVIGVTKADGTVLSAGGDAPAPPPPAQ